MGGAGFIRTDQKVEINVERRMRCASHPNDKDNKIIRDASSGSAVDRYDRIAISSYFGRARDPGVRSIPIDRPRGEERIVLSFCR